MNTTNKLSPEGTEELLKVLETRFLKNLNRHQGIDWSKVEAKLKANPEKLWSLDEMERTEGEPDVVGYDAKTDEYIFYDCSPESPKGRRSICYDHEALEKRKEHKPKDSAINMADEMGIQIFQKTSFQNPKQFFSSFSR